MDLKQLQYTFLRFDGTKVFIAAPADNVGLWMFVITAITDTDFEGSSRYILLETLAAICSPLLLVPRILPTPS
jgi:hypothetical protein